MSSQVMSESPFVICIDNTDYYAALEVRKIYQTIPDSDAARHQYVRIIDESGEDYLYPARLFLALDIPPAIQAVLIRAA
jgi:hypothetical protein